ncbi:hypothetical protein E6C50_03015 [Flavobacterium supellecticarium]|uniref:Uncharacterized protein n=1 Tax=Flavobacterium supellecticarium TaxID=2565924 RepID=A0A4S4A410_9FLAO|nr:hypothetical protein [Flavobacterium supellecticarium]THF53189.1 hypothetical protein E6C50_03015 [Flavobacterium supellecticarium]
MKIIELREIQNTSENSKLPPLYTQFQKLLEELRKKELPDALIESINQDIEVLNTTTLTDDKLRKLLKDKQTKIVQLVEKEVKIVPQKYYMTLWLAIGMSAFGIPLGTVLGLSLGNMGLLGIGLPIGMAIGIAVGTNRDKKALQEGRQLNVVIKY